MTCPQPSICGPESRAGCWVCQPDDEPLVAAECTCFPVENPWTYYGIVEPGGAMEPNPECLIHFPAEVDQLAQERYYEMRDEL